MHKKLMYYSSRSWEVENQDGSRFVRLSFWFTDSNFLPVISYSTVISHSTLLRVLISLLKAPPLCPNHLPKTSPSNTIILGVQFPHMNTEHKHSVFSRKKVNKEKNGLWLLNQANALRSKFLKSIQYCKTYN